MLSTIVHIIDDDPSVCRTLEKLFASVEIRTRSYKTAQAYLTSEATPECHGECLLLEVRMPGSAGLDFQHRLAASNKLVPIIMMTGHADARTGVWAMKAGAVDFIAKPFRDQEMLEAVTAALELDCRRRVMSDDIGRMQALFAKLSPREQQIMREVITIFPQADDDACKEANHRIANSLQLLAALLSHQGRAVGDSSARDAIELSVQRIAAVAGVHRQLYLSADFASVDLEIYLKDLIAGLRNSFGGELNGHLITLETGQISVSGEFATTLGVIVTELVINALKHAFGPDKTGQINVMLSVCEAGGFTLEVADGGIGRRLGSNDAGGFGSRIVALMVRKLGAQGSYIERPLGTSFRIIGTLPPLRIGRRQPTQPPARH